MEKTKGPLYGVDPDDRAEVKVEGAVFLVGPIPSGLWEELAAKRGVAYQDAFMRAVKSLSERGIDAAEIVSKPEAKVKMTLADKVANEDPAFIRLVTELAIEATSYGVRGHSGFLTRKGEEIPFERDGEVLAEKTMRYYRLNVVVCRMIYTELHSLNELGEQAKKV